MAPSKSVWCMDYKTNHAECVYDGMRGPDMLGCSCECHNKEKKKMRIFVTQNDINKGTRMHAGKCAVALTLSRLFDTDNVDVSTSGGIRAAGKSYSTTPELRNFIRAFDAGKPVRPALFEIEEVA